MLKETEKFRYAGEIDLQARIIIIKMIYIHCKKQTNMLNRNVLQSQSDAHQAHQSV